MLRFRERLFGSDLGVAILIGAVSLGVYLWSMRAPNPYDHFGRLAQAFLRGEYWLNSPLFETQTGRGGHIFVVYPPLPALLLVPLAPFGRSDVIQTLGSALIGGFCAIPQFFALRALAAPRAVASLCTLLAVFGTTLWFTSVDGSSWFIAGASGSLLVTIAFWLAATRRSALFIGAAVGAAALAHTTIGLAALPLMFLARSGAPRRRSLSMDIALLLLGVAPFAIFQGWYDWVRWGDVLSIYGPACVGGISDGVARQCGPASLDIRFFPRHLFAIFFSGPAFVDGGLFFVRPRSDGMAILFGTPAFIWIARSWPAVRRNARWRTIVIAALCIAVPNALLAVVGAAQYGYRYSLDYQPFLIALTAAGAAYGNEGWRPESNLFRAAVLLSIGLTAYFFAAIRAVGWV